MPKSRLAFWQKKFDQNVERDRKVCHDLKSLGWRVVTIWECQVEAQDLLAKQIRKLLPPR